MSGVAPWREGFQKSCTWFAIVASRLPVGVERCIHFTDATWLAEHLAEVRERVQSLATFVESGTAHLWLLGLEDRNRPGRWSFDVRFISHLEGTALLLEESASPPSIRADLDTFIAWLESQTPLEVREL